MRRISICKELKTFSDMPVVMITARVDEIDRLLGFESGADDYIFKPFSPREVVARVKAILRRVNHHVTPAQAHELVLDESSFSASLDGETLQFTPVEFRLLKALASVPGKTLTRPQLLAHLYLDHRVVEERTVDTHLKNVRQKLAAACPNRDFIRSAYGVGYCWRV